jgi:hypothetical protein
MGLLDKLVNQGGSNLTSHDGATPPTNPLATKQSRMHADPSGQPSYSLNGSNFSVVNNDYQMYEDGDNNFLPPFSQLDVNGITPLTPLKDPGVSSINDSFSKGEYLKNLPN